MTDFNSSSDNAPSGLTNNTLTEADSTDCKKSPETFCEPTRQGKRKRSQSINLLSMRKAFRIKPLALGVASVMLTACGGDKEEAKIYTSIEDCQQDFPDALERCEAAYQTAVDEAMRTSPRFSTEYDCEYEFGPNQCRSVDNGSGSFFMPFMAGYMVSSLLSPSRYYSQPLYTSYSYNSPFRSRWITADGYVFDGDIRKRNYRVSKDAFKPKPTVNRTIKRGGFGSSVRAKSSWGSSSRSGSWGS
ncbi:hypothetical protein KUL42_04190 [Alteromonas sp. KUL42]|uniref:DUF1190 family protein n=1 Tax=Alteromonas sp. KUL42 TaxID=2480797 RepID=UPI000ADA080A|nr:DUF1190 family protein [Alteromonas sp. KUL42]TAP38408.1 DUF1190 family protein [Alteromonas sp. KUL42]GEA05658.1 hypothetical protein KUL42_04190 [Alteromonas sp. KUL42]